jgi:hypothetical protein
MQAADEFEALCYAGMARENSSSRLRVRYRTADVCRRLVLPQPFIDDLAQQVVPGPGQVLHFRDQLGG